MAKFTALILFCLGSANIASAQTPANNLMPDGSRDMYLGLGAVSQTRYEGSKDTRVSALPAVQMQWSNGIFVAGMSAGMHLSEQAGQEFGPLLTIEAGRSISGSGHGISCPRCDASPSITGSVAPANTNKLAGMDDINPRVLIGGFYNAQLASKLRLTNNLVFGGGNQRQGLRLNSDLRYSLDDFAAHHNVSISVF